MISRLKAVLHSGERASMFVYLQAGRRRARELVEERLNRRALNGDGPLEGGVAQGARTGILPELAAALDELHEKLIPESRRAKLEATRSRVKDALDARGIANLARREQRSIYEPPLAVPGPGR